MKVESVNLGSKEFISWKGKEKSTGIFKRPVASGEILVETNGVSGDYIAETKVHGGPEMACYVYSRDHYNYWKGKYPDLDWHWGIFGENITISGFDEQQINIGDQLKIGDALLEIAQPRIPCYKLGARFGTQTIVKDFLQYGRCGAYVRVLREGTIRKGDIIQHVSVKNQEITMYDMFSLLTTNKNNEKLKQKALEHPKLADSYKESISRGD